jgi:lysophospholipid acyltransferase (LPLAT)-like uncharacterized protein
MQSDLTNAFTFGPLDRYSFRQRAVIRTVGILSYFVIRLIGSTIRFQVTNPEFEEEIMAAGKLPIYTFWHDRMIAGTYFFRNRGINVLSSQSFDSEYTARCIQRFGYGIVKGSSTRGAVAGMVGMIRAMRRGSPSGFTVDGPKGPKYKAKSGPVLLAKKTGNPILPFVVECKRFWQLKSWDCMQVPKPFTTANVMFAAPIYVDPNGGDEELESKLMELQIALDDLVNKGHEWRNSNQV